MSGLVLVTGASGKLGSQVMEFLLERLPATQVAAMTRQPEELVDLSARGVSVRFGDYFKPDSLEQAFQGCVQTPLSSAMAFTDVKAAHRNVIAAAKTAGVRHIHYTAIQRSPGSSFVIPQVTEWDADTERALAESGLATTVLRNSQYLDSLDDLIGKIATDRVIRVPAGHAQTAQATRRDIAEATAGVLATNGHEGRSYTLAASEAVLLDDIAKVIGGTEGSTVTYQDTSLEDYVAICVAAGMPEPAARFTGAWFQAIAAGEFASRGDIEDLIGRPPKSVGQFLAERRSG